MCVSASYNLKFPTKITHRACEILFPLFSWRLARVLNEFVNSEKQFIFSRKFYFQLIFRFLFVASNNIFGLPGSSNTSIAFVEHKPSAAKKQKFNETVVTYLKLYHHHHQ